jgi:hypothetical protein
VSLKAGTFQKNRSRLTCLLKADGAAECQAGVTCGDTSKIDKQSAHRFARRYLAALMRKSKRLGQSRGARGEARARGGGDRLYPHSDFKCAGAPDSINKHGGPSMCPSEYTDRQVLSPRGRFVSRWLAWNSRPSVTRPAWLRRAIIFTVGPEEDLRIHSHCIVEL